MLHLLAICQFIGIILNDSKGVKDGYYHWHLKCEEVLEEINSPVCNIL